MAHRRGLESRRDRLIEIAASLFEANGYHQTSMENLAEAADLAKPSLYYYFNSKEEILFGIHLKFILPLIEAHERRLAAGASPEELLRGALEDQMGMGAASPGMVKVFFEHRRELQGEHRSNVRANRVRYRQLIEDAIRAGIESGAFREIDPRATAFAFFGMINWAYKSLSSSRSLGPHEMAHFVFDLLLRGIAAEERDTTAS